MVKAKEERNWGDWIRSCSKVAAFAALCNAASVAVGQPFDVFKTRKHANPTLKYPQIAADIVKEGNILKGLYGGTSPKLAAMVFKGIYRTPLMAVPEIIKHQLPEETVENYPLVPTLLAVPPMVVLSCGLKMPIDTIARLKMIGGSTTSLTAIVKQVWQAPYKGVELAAVKETMGWGFFLAVDDVVRDNIQEALKGIKNEKEYASAISGVAITLVRIVFNNPLDLMLTDVLKNGVTIKAAAETVMKRPSSLLLAGMVPKLVMGYLEATTGSHVRSMIKQLNNEQQYGHSR